MNVPTRIGFAAFGAVMGYAAYMIIHADKQSSQTNALASGALGAVAGYFVGRWFTI